MTRAKWRKIGLWALACFALLFAVAASNTLRNRAEITITTDTPAERRALLEPAWRMLPEGTPVTQAKALLMSGCDGPHDNMTYWATIMAQNERPSLILDSHAPRLLGDFPTWLLVCTAQILPGSERAGDIAVALSASNEPKMTLLGASHGGWSIMELLDRLSTGEVPPGLTEWPSPPEALSKRIDRVILIYPYCGVMNGARKGDWSDFPPVLLLAAENDSVVSTPTCLQMVDDLRARGATVETVVLPEVDHGFDQDERPALSMLELVPEARSAARREIERFLH